VSEHSPEAVDHQRDLIARIAETSPAGIVVVSREGQITYANPCAVKLLGLTRDEIAGSCYNAPRWWIEYCDGTPVPEEDLPFHRTMDLPQSIFDVRRVVVWPDGGRLFLSINVAPLFDVAGQPDGMVVTSADISEQVWAEEKLRESERKYRMLFENMTAGFALHEMIYDEQGRPLDYRYLEINPAFERLTGVPVKTLLGKTVKEVMPGTEQYWIDVFGKVARTGEPTAYQNYAGELNRCYDVWAFSPVKNQFAVVFVDITERMRAEEALRESETRYRALVENSLVGVTHVAPDGRTVYANPAMLSMFEAESLDEIGGGEFRSLFAPDSREVVDRELEKRSRGIGSTYEAEIAGLRGGRRNVVMSGAPLLSKTGELIGSIGSVTDITERKRAEELLRQRVEELAALNTLGQMVNATLALEEAMEAALAGVLRAVRPDLAFLFQRDGERLILKDMLPRDSRPRLGEIPEHRVGECICGLAVREKKPLYSRDIFGDYRCSWEECKWAGIKSFAALPLTSGGEIIGVIGLASNTERDFEWQGGFLETLANQVSIALTNARLYEMAQQELAERKRTEEALRSSDSHYRTLFESANDAIFVIEDGVYRDCNAAAIRVFGRSRQELLGHSPAELSVARQPDGRDSWEVAEEKLRAALEGKPQFFNWMHLAGDGATLLVEVSLNRLDTVSGSKLLAIVRDVTERNRTEELLRKSEREKAAILDGIKDVTIEYLDPELRIIWRNNATSGASGCTSAEMCGKFCYEVARNRDTPCPDCTALKALQTGRPHEGEVTMPSGRTMLVRSNPIKDADGLVVGVVHAVVDITERRQAEEKLKHMQVQLAHVARLSTVGELAAEIAHELSQPLYAIANYAKASRNQLAAGGSSDLESLRDSNEKIERIAAGAGGICKRLRSFARRAESDRSSCDVNEIVMEAIMMMTFEAREKKVVLETAIHPAPLVVSANRVEIQQVFVNLLHNAFEAMEGVEDRIRQATIRTKEIGKSVEIVVCDNGVGLPANDQRNIFEAFVTTKPDGLGMGLAISSTIVESHGGRLRASSNPEGGASFHCLLPLVEGDRAHVK
jgi:PAS domain S-box-containing protein